MGLFGFFQRKDSLASSGVLRGAVDRHSHILFGVDDGVKTLEDSLQALRLEEEAGVADVWCTPHVMEDVPNTTASLRARFDELCAAYSGPVRLHLAAEYMLDNLFEERLARRDLLLMEDDVVLVETSTMTPPYNLDEIFAAILSSGYRPMLAHPERYRYLSDADYDGLLARGLRFQLNLPSLLGFYGETAMQKARHLLAKGAYSAVGTDCHRAAALPELYFRKELTADVLKKLNILMTHAD